MSEWQPIETAPTDNEPVLVWDPVDGLTAYPSVYIAYKPDWTKNDDWWRMNGEDGYSCRPTHWMPLPLPPAEM